MKNLDQVVRDLEDIVANNISNYILPESKGSTIKIGDIVVRPSKQSGYVVVDTRLNKTVSTAYSKSGAVAISLAYIRKQNIKPLAYYDSVVEKYSNDREFYSHIVETTARPERKSAIQNRLEEADSKIQWATSFLNDYIMKDI